MVIDCPFWLRVMLLPPASISVPLDIEAVAPEVLLPIITAAGDMECEWVLSLKLAVIELLVSPKEKLFAFPNITVPEVSVEAFEPATPDIPVCWAWVAGHDILRY